MTDVNTGTAFSYNPFNAAHQHDPRRLGFFLSADPVMRVPLSHDGPARYFMAFGLEAIDATLRGQEFGVSSVSDDMRKQRIMRLDLPVSTLICETFPFLLDGEDHARAHKTYLKMIQAALTPRSVALVDACIADDVRRLKESCVAQTVTERGVADAPEVDLAGLFNLWATRIMLKLLGFPASLASEATRWIRVFTKAADMFASDQALVDAEFGAARLFELLEAFVDADEMRHGIAANLFEKEDRGEMGRDNALAAIAGLLAAAAENPSGSMVAAVRGLVTHPDQLELVRQDPTAVYRAAEETFRWFTNQGYILRQARAECTLAGVRLAAGDIVACVTESIHQDPDLHPSPEDFIVNRESRHVRSFGGGAWGCSGTRLGREMVARTIQHLLLDEHPRITFSGEEQFHYEKSFLRLPARLYATCYFGDGDRRADPGGT